MASGSLSEDISSFNIDINRLQDYEINLKVTSGDKISTKVYQVYIHYPRTIQEGLRVGSRLVNYMDENGVVEERLLYSLQKSYINGEKLRDDDTVNLYEPINSVDPFLSCYIYCDLPKDRIVPGTTGTWRVEIIRDGNTIISDEYQYDFTIPPVITKDVGLQIKIDTKEELIQKFVDDQSSHAPYVKGFTVYLNPEKLRQVIPNASYVAIGNQDMHASHSTLPSGLSKGEMKATVLPLGYTEYNMGDLKKIQYERGGEYHLTGTYFIQNDQAPTKVTNDQFLYFVFYDEQLNIIGQYIAVVAYDQDHVADGYTPAYNWNPTPSS